MARWIGAAVLLGAVALSAGSWWMGNRLTAAAHRPVPVPADLAVEAIKIPDPGTAGLAAWWAQASPQRGAVLLLHSIRADRSSMVPRARVLLQEGFSVLLVDLQAHGESPGKTITLGLRESGNGRSALAWLRSRVPRGRIGVIGTSLGGAAVLLGPQPSGFDAIVLEAVYPDVRTAVQNRLRIRLGPLAPIVAPFLLLPRLGAPVLVVAGQLDRHTTLAESEALYAEAVPPKDLWVVAGARHQDFLSKDPEGYREHVVGFLRRHLLL